MSAEMRERALALLNTSYLRNVKEDTVIDGVEIKSIVNYMILFHEDEAKELREENKDLSRRLNHLETGAIFFSYRDRKGEVQHGKVSVLSAGDLIGLLKERSEKMFRFIEEINEYEGNARPIADVEGGD